MNPVGILFKPTNLHLLQRLVGISSLWYDFHQEKTRILTSGSAHHIQPCWAMTEEIYRQRRHGSDKISFLILSLRKLNPWLFIMKNSETVLRSVFIIRIDRFCARPTKWGKHILNFMLKALLLFFSASSILRKLLPLFGNDSSLSGELVKSGTDDVFIDLGFDILKIQVRLHKSLIRPLQKRMRETLSRMSFLSSL